MKRKSQEGFVEDMPDENKYKQKMYEKCLDQIDDKVVDEKGGIINYVSAYSDLQDIFEGGKSLNDIKKRFRRMLDRLLQKELPKI